MKSTRRLERLMLPERNMFVGSSLLEAERRLSEFAESQADLLNLSHADTRRFPPPGWFLDEFDHAVKEGADVFTPCRGDRRVLAALAPSLSRFLGVEVDPESELAVTPGTQAALFCVLAALVQTGDTVLLADPDYLTNERTLRFLGADVHHVGLTMLDARLTIDLEQVEQGLRKGGRLLLFSHPSNPTGAVYDHATVSALARLIVEFDAMVIVDELYARLLYDGSTFHHLISEPGMKERCITTFGPSKTESMSGYRIGCIVGPTQALSAVVDILDITVIRAPGYAQHALKRWLVDDEEFVRQRVEELEVLRDMTVEHLRQLDFIAVTPPMATAYVFPYVSGIQLNDFEVAEALIEKARVIVNPGIAFGPRGARAFRLCFAQDERVWGDALERISGALDSLRSGS